MKAFRFIAWSVPSRCRMQSGATSLRPCCYPTSAQELSIAAPESQLATLKILEALLSFPSTAALLTQRGCCCSEHAYLLRRVRASSASKTQGETMLWRPPCQRWPCPWGGEEPRSHPNPFDQALLSPRAAAGAHPTLAPLQLRQARR